jgi:hypothetical protein
MRLQFSKVVSGAIMASVSGAALLIGAGPA